MKSKRFVPFIVLSILMVLVMFSACTVRPTAPTPVPDLAYTQAAETIIAQLTEAAPVVSDTPEVLEEIATFTPIVEATATAIPEEPTVEPAQPEEPTSPPPTAESAIPTAIPLITAAAVPTFDYQFPTAIPLGGSSSLPTITPFPTFPPPVIPTYPPIPTAVQIIPVPLGVITTAPPAGGFPTAIPLPAVITQSMPAQFPLRTIFTDDFSNHTSWTVDEGINWKLRFDQGGYRMFADFANDGLYSAKTGDSFSDVRLEADATRVGGSSTSYYGLTCRFQNGGNYYGLVISGDGTFGILKKQGGKIQFLQESGPTPIINYGNTPNRIRADCFANTLSLYVDGYLLMSIQDSSFLSGFVGLLVGNRDETWTDVIFDNFVIMAP